jgi:DNA polymerase III epsilon subunit-like protein
MYLALDTETTGLTNLCNVLTVYFIILDENLNEIKTLDLKIKHDKYHVYTKALEINKINLVEHDKTAISKEDAIIKMKEFFGSVIYDVIGHNVKFDITILKSNGMDINTHIKTGYIDTFNICRKLKQQQKLNEKQSLSLGKLCYYFGVGPVSCENLHTSEHDTRLSVELFKHLKEFVL